MSLAARSAAERSSRLKKSGSRVLVEAVEQITRGRPLMAGSRLPLGCNWGSNAVGRRA